MIRKIILLLFFTTSVVAWGATTSLKTIDTIKATGGSTLTVPSTGSTFSSESNTQTLSNKSLSGSSNTFTNIPGATAISGTIPVANTVVANQSAGTCTTSKTIDWSTGNSFTLTLTNASACAITFSNAISGQVITIDYTQAASGGGTATVTYSTTTKWSAGTTPTMTTGNSATDTCTFKYNGTDYRGSCVQNLL